MADKPFANLGMDFMSWQSAPSLTGGALERVGSGLKKAVIPALLQASGLPAFLDTLGQSPEAPKAPVAPPSVGVAPSAVPTMMTQQPAVEEDLNETIWSR